MRVTRRRPNVPAPVTRCRAKRLALGWSQAKVAELSGVPQPYVSRVEHQEPILREDLEKIGEALGLDPNLLMEEEE
jgi:transcriptional regulator with XRE-family HTH domain